MIKVLLAGCILFLASCSVIETKFDEKAKGVFIKGEKEYCSHSKNHQDLIIDEINERLPNSKMTWECN